MLQPFHQLCCFLHNGKIGSAISTVGNTAQQVYCFRQLCLYILSGWQAEKLAGNVLY